MDRYALALMPSRAAASEAEDEAPFAKPFPARVLLDWNPPSAISARALILAAENHIGRVDEAILVCDPRLAPCAADLGLSE